MVNAGRQIDDKPLRADRPHQEATRTRTPTQAGRSLAARKAKPANLQVHLRGNPDDAGRGGAAAVPGASSPATTRTPFTQGSGRLELAAGDRQQGQPADGPRDRQPHLAAPLRPRARRHAEQLRRAGRAADASRAARPPGASVRRATAGRSRRCTARSCCRPPISMSSRHDEPGGRGSIPTTGCCGA